MIKPYLTKAEVDQLLNTCKKVFKRTYLRNYLIILLLYRHALRVSELCDLTWREVDTKSNRLTVYRKKNGKSGYHPMQNDTLRTIERYKKTKYAQFDHVFCTSQGKPLDRFVINEILKRLCQYLGWKRYYPHILRHSCGYHLGNQKIDFRLIQDYMGHSRTESTVIYTKTNPERFKDIQW